MIRAASGNKRTAGLNVAALEGLYRKYNKRCYVSPDPLEFVYMYKSRFDMEIAGLIASSLAFGNVRQIRGSVARVLDVLGDSPAECVREARGRDLSRALADFKHRWITGADVVSMLGGVRAALKEYGSLRDLFYASSGAADRDVVPATERFAAYIRGKSDGFRPCLLPSPASGSACKRLNLFLRWMVRSDAVDPGGWSEVSPAMLVVPLDTHMYRISKKFVLTTRRTADLMTAREITDGFRRISPEDPVRYDFALTRLGILKDDPMEVTLASLCG
ncbi:MAG: TIGR02757 family protein [Candidatus Krumholzibacteria bacterium]|nr:TIGR02757 family protein [Candidatus Krumholzibacteria bacterium]